MMSRWYALVHDILDCGSRETAATELPVGASLPHDVRSV